MTKHPHNRRERMQLEAARKKKFVKKNSQDGRRATVEEKEAEDDFRDQVR